MLIRSQDKKKVVSLNSNIDMIHVLDNDILIGNVLFGSYDSEEKAIKVLDMICTRADNLHYNMMEAIGSHSMRVVEPKYDIVFEMPAADIV